MKNTRKRKGTTGSTRFSKARFDELVGEAIVDCYNESEQATGLYTMVEEHLAESLSPWSVFSCASS